MERGSAENWRWRHTFCTDQQASDVCPYPVYTA